MAKRARPKQNGKKYALAKLACSVPGCNEDFFVAGPTYHPTQRLCKYHWLNPPVPAPTTIQNQVKRDATKQVLRDLGLIK